MNRLLFVLAVVVVAAPAVALDGRLAAQAPKKPDHTVVPPPADPEVIRQGGDTVESALPFDAIPFQDIGTTSGYTDDYDEACPYTVSTSPDVVFVWTPGDDVHVDVDMLGSTYDTKIDIYCFPSATSGKAGGFHTWIKLLSSQTKTPRGASVSVVNAD